MTFEVDLNGKQMLPLETVKTHLIKPSHGWSGLVKAGQFIKVMDPRGRQCADFWAFSANDLDEHLSAMHTRVWVNRLCPTIGESFHSNRRRPILQLIADTCGQHDLLTAACDEYRYRLYGVTGHHRSCTGNLREVMGERFGSERFYVPQPFNIFASIPVGADGSVLNGPAPSRAGDYVVLRAWFDVVVAVSACPQQFNPIAGWYPSEIQVDIMEPGMEIMQPQSIPPARPVV